MVAESAREGEARERARRGEGRGVRMECEAARDRFEVVIDSSFLRSFDSVPRSPENEEQQADRMRGCDGLRQRVVRFKHGAWQRLQWRMWTSATMVQARLLAWLRWRGRGG